MSELFKVAGPDGQPRASVLLVHGLDGHHYDTWRCGAEKLWNEDETFWPHWLARDCESLAVYVIRYDAPASRWRGTAMHLTDQATSILARLLAEPALARRPLTLIGHSLGGLLIKQLLRTAESTGRYDRRAADLIEQVEKVVLLGTPHSGAGLATWADRLRILLRPSAATASLVRNDPNLRDLNIWYRDWANARGIAHLILTETKPTSILGMIVPPDSADPGLVNVRAVPIAADHIRICKPTDRTKDIYVFVREFVTRPVERPEQYSKTDRGLPNAPEIVDCSPDLEVTLNAAEAFTTALTRSKWAQETVVNWHTLPEGMYEPSMKSDEERRDKRLRRRLDGEIHDHLSLGRLVAWGRIDSARPLQQIERKEWTDIEISFDDRSLTSTPARVIAYKRSPRLSGTRIAYVDIQFSSREFYRLYSLAESKSDTGDKGSEARAGENAMLEKFKDIRIAVIVALAEEYELFCRYFHGKVVEKFHVLDLTIDILERDDGSERIGLVSVNRMGNVAAAIAATRLLEIFDLDLVTNIGLAAGVNKEKQALGDIVVAESILYYETGKLTADSFSNTSAYSDLHSSFVRALATENLTSWPLGASIGGRPRQIFFGTVASGEKVVANPDFVQSLLLRDRKIIGIEMESYGISAAIYGRKEKLLLIRGISDFADQSKNDNARLSAMEGAMRFFNEAMRRGLLRPPAASSTVLPQRAVTPPEYVLTLTNREVHEGIANNYVQIVRNKTIDDFKYRKSVIEKIAKKFSLGDLRSFCIALKLDFDEIKGEAKTEKAAGILEFVERKELLTVEELEALIDGE